MIGLNPRLFPHDVLTLTTDSVDLCYSSNTGKITGQMMSFKNSGTERLRCNMSVHGSLRKWPEDNNIIREDEIAELLTDQKWQDDTESHLNDINYFRVIFKRKDIFV